MLATRNVHLLGLGAKQNSSQMMRDSMSSMERGVLENEYMYVEMAHYTDDDTLALICISNINDF